MVKKLSNMADAAIWDAQVNKSSTNPDYNRAIKKQGFFLDTHQIVAKRIKNGEPVGDFWLRGKAKEALLDQTDLKQSDFSKYNGWLQMYGKYPENNS